MGFPRKRTERGSNSPILQEGDIQARGVTTPFLGVGEHCFKNHLELRAHPSGIYSSTFRTSLSVPGTSCRALDSKII